MAKKAASIPVNPMADAHGSGITLDRLQGANLPTADPAAPVGIVQAAEPHREDRHAFFLLEAGRVHLEIDFRVYQLEAPALVYLHPDQVHRIVALRHVTVSSLGLAADKLNPTYLHLLEELVPASPLVLTAASFALVAETMALCLKFSARPRDVLYHALLQDSCNTLVALCISHYLQHVPPLDKLPRPELLTKAFKKLLESSYTTTKRPADYAQQLHISTPYLNECVKRVTGQSVSQAIQQRVILEAKRLLYHSEQSVKEIAAALGYDDYPYFCRLFTTVTGMSALAFRRTHLD